MKGKKKLMIVKLRPFTPKGILIYKSNKIESKNSKDYIEYIIEIKSIGSYDYNSMDSTF